MSKYITVRNKRGHVSFILNKHTVVINVLLFGLSMMLFILGLCVGSTLIHPFAVLEQIVGLGNGDYAFTIHSLRMPRMLLSTLVGAALGVSGLILQGMIRNPLASPDIIGITGGASVAAVVFLTFLSGYLSVQWIPLAAIIGAATVSFVLYILAWQKGVTPIRLVLIGIGLSAAMGALTTMMIVLSPTATASQAYIWMTGSVYGASWREVYAMLPWVLIFIPLVLWFSSAVNVQQLGDHVAKGLGVNVQRQRFCLLMISVALAGSAVAFAGGIGFVGLIAPHIARRLIGHSFVGLVLAAGMIGGMIVSSADMIARTAFLPLDIPAGVFTAGIGAPFFIYLLYKNRNK